MAGWSNEKILYFINEVQVRRELWDVKYSLYKDRNAKKDAWATVAAKFNISIEEAYRKFRNLRTYAQTESKKNKNGKVSWFAHDAISFILSRDLADTETDTKKTMMGADNEIHSAEKFDSWAVPLPTKTFSKKANRIRAKDTRLATQIINYGGRKRHAFSGSFGMHVANKLNSYDRYIRAQVELKISKILYEADMAMYRRDSCSISSTSNDSIKQNPETTDSTSQTLKYEEQ